MAAMNATTQAKMVWRQYRNHRTMQWSLTLYYTILVLCGLVVLGYLIESARLGFYRKKTTGCVRLYCQVKNLLQKFRSASIKLSSFSFELPLYASCLWLFFAAILTVALLVDTPDVSFQHQYDLMTISKRLGHHASALLPVLFLLSSKNSVLALLMGSSHEKLNITHRWLGRTIILLIALHAICYTLCYQKSGSLYLLRSRTNIYGEISAAAFLLILLSSLGIMRHLGYEVFYLTHISLTIVVLVTAWLHDEKTIPFIRASVALIALDRGIRVLRTLYVSWSHHEAHFMLIGPKLLRVTVKLGHTCLPLKWSPGSHVFLNIPALSGHQQHPFTIASCSEEGLLELYVAKHSGFTSRLFKDSLQKTHFCLIDGPYGSLSLSRFGKYPKVLLLTAGSGITFGLPIFKSLLRNAADCMELTLVWSTNCPATFGHFKSEIQDYIRAISLHIPSTMQASVQLHYTGTRQSNLEEGIYHPDLPAFSEKPSIPSKESCENANFKSTVLIGRCDIEEVVRESLDSSERLALGYCGPRDFAQKVTKVSCNAIGCSTKDVWLFDETFGW